MDPFRKLTPEARAITHELLRRHEEIRAQFSVHTAKSVTDGMIRQSVISYGVLCQRVGAPFLTHCVGHFLGEIAECCANNCWPPLNALAVNSETGMPGEGYDDADGCSLLHWPDEIKRCIAFDRYPASAST
jgi:hypothetical protein